MYIVDCLKQKNISQRRDKLRTDESSRVIFL